MSKEYIGPFGPESIEAAGVEMSRHEFEDDLPDGCTWDELGRGREEWAAVGLSAAVGALDREALVAQYEAILREHGVKVSARTVVYGDAHHRFRTNIASALVEALFPTEPEVQDGR